MKYKQKKTYLFRGLGDTFQHPQGCQWRSSSSACQQRSSGMFFWPHGQLEWQFASAPGCCGTAELETTPSQAGAYSVGSGWLVEMRGCVIVLCKRQEQGQGQGSFQKWVPSWPVVRLNKSPFIPDCQQYMTAWSFFSAKNLNTWGDNKVCEHTYLKKCKRV